MNDIYVYKGNLLGNQWLSTASPLLMDTWYKMQYHDIKEKNDLQIVGRWRYKQVYRLCPMCGGEAVEYIANSERKCVKCREIY